MIGIVYTSEGGYGCVEWIGKNPPAEQVLTDEERSQLPEMVQVKLKNGTTALVARTGLFNKIMIRVKSFHGARKIYSLEAHIGENVENLKDKLMKADTGHDLEKFSQIQLFSTIVSFFFLLRHGL